MMSHMVPPTRPSWDMVFFDIAYIMSTRATCPRKHVGAVLTRNNRIIATGYNGAPSGEPHCTDEGVGCLMVDGHCVRTIHAEMNCILQCAIEGIDLKDTELWITTNPCVTCRAAFLQVGVKAVHVQQLDYDEPGREDVHPISLIDFMKRPASEWEGPRG